MFEHEGTIKKNNQSAKMVTFFNAKTLSTDYYFLNCNKEDIQKVNNMINQTVKITVNIHGEICQICLNYRIVWENK